MATSEKTDTPTVEVEKQIAQIQAEIAELTRVLTAIAGTKVRDMKAAAQGETEHLLHRTREMADAAEGKARDAAEALEDHIKGKPIQSALIALMIGLFFGVLSRR